MTSLPTRCPVLPLRDRVVFPHAIVPLHIGREKSINALDRDAAIMRARKQILLVTQKNAGDDEPEPAAIHRVGVLAIVLQAMKLDDGSIKGLFECGARATIRSFTDRMDYLEAEVAPFAEILGSADVIATLARSAVLQFANYVELNKKISPEALAGVRQIMDPSKLADIIASHLPSNVADKQEILETATVSDRLQRVLAIMRDPTSDRLGGQIPHDPPTSASSVVIGLPKLSFTRYTGRFDWSSHEAPHPTWEQIEASLRRLNQFEYPNVWLLLGDGSDWSLMEKEGYLNIMGGNGSYCVDGATPSDGRRRLVMSNHSRVKRVDVWLSDQGYATEEIFVCKDIETVVRVARHFCVHRRLDPSAEWVPAVAVGIWDLF